MLLVSLLSIAIFVGGILGTLILKSPLFKSKPNTYLAYAIFTLSFSLLNYILDEAGAYASYPFLIFIDVIDSGVLFPTFIFMYIVHQVDHPIKDSKKIQWLFAPYVLTTLHSILDEIAINLSYDESPFFKVMADIIGLISIPLMLLFIPGIFMYAYTFINYSKSPETKTWLKQLWFLAFLLFFSWILVVVSGIFIDNGGTHIVQGLVILAIFLIYWTTYKGIFKLRLAQDRREIKVLLNKLNPDKNSIPTQEKASAPPTPQPIPQQEEKTETFTEENTYFQTLEELCKTQHIYKDSSLDREKVAEMLGISSGYVSQLVNKITGDNFATYINCYRVEAVKTLILDESFDNYSLLAMGLECGFSSKTTFHNSFKKVVGMTPNAYRKMYR